MSILVIGSLAFDDIVTDHGTVNDAPGGSALYFAAAAAHFSPVSILGVVGEDFPQGELDDLTALGVNMDHLKVIPGAKTFRWGGCYETDMNKRTTTNLELNVFEQFDPELDDELAASEFVFLGNIDPDLQLKVLSQANRPKLVGADTIECYIHDKPERFREVLSKVDLVFVNDDEARLITGEFNIITAAKKLLELGPDYAVVKKGEHGSILAMRDGLFIVPAYPIASLVDPTGAGDSFAGAAFGYLARHGEVTPDAVKKAVVYGGIVASFTVEDFSLGRLKSITKTDIEERLALFRAVTLF